MTTIKFTEISKLKDEIDHALDENNFEELNNLSNNLEAIVKTLVEDKDTARNLSQKARLMCLLSCLKMFLAMRN